MSEAVISLRNVSKRYGKQRVLEDVSLDVPRGATYAFLGRNGAGKTTTIRALLGLLAPESGEVRVLGLDPRRHALEIRRRVGYLAEDQQMWGWMRIRQLLSFLAPFYPTWDPAHARDLCERFELSPRTRVKHLSKGQSVRLGLLVALAHRPELVILDDPALGLDPILRKQLTRDVIDELQSSGATVFFSSHLLYEVEPVADRIGILERGRMIRQTETEALRDEVKRLVFSDADADLVSRLPGVLDVTWRGRQVAVVVDRVAAAREVAAEHGATPDVVDLNLDEIFEALVIGRRHATTNPPPTGLERVA